MKFIYSTQLNGLSSAQFTDCFTTKFFLQCKILKALSSMVHQLCYKELNTKHSFLFEMFRCYKYMPYIETLFKRRKGCLYEAMLLVYFFHILNKAKTSSSDLYVFQCVSLMSKSQNILFSVFLDRPVLGYKRSFLMV